MIPNSTLFDGVLTSGLHGYQCAAVGLATPNHRCQAGIHVCLTPTSDYASQQHDMNAMMSPDSRCDVLALRITLPINTALFSLGPHHARSQAVRLRFPPGGLCNVRCAAMRLHYAGCNAGAHRYSQSAAAFSDRESWLRISAHRAWCARAASRCGDNSFAASKSGQNARIS
jgi:hypothetical protein